MAAISQMGPLHTLLITRILKATSTGLWVPLLHQAPDTLSRPPLFPVQAECFSQWIPGCGRADLLWCSWITVKNCQGKYDQVDSFSDITLFVFLAFCLLPLTPFHFSLLSMGFFLCKIKGLSQLLSNCAAWHLLEAWLGPVEGGRR